MEHLELDKRWKVKEMLPTFPQERADISAPYFTGKEVLTTNGHVLLVFPHTDKKAKPGFICEPQKSIDGKVKKFPVGRCKKYISEKKKFTIAFNMKYLRRILEAIGYEEEVDAHRIVFEFDTNKTKDGLPNAIKIRFKRDVDNKAFAILMPLRPDDAVPPTLRKKHK